MTKSLLDSFGDVQPRISPGDSGLHCGSCTSKPSLVNNWSTTLCVLSKTIRKKTRTLLECLGSLCEFYLYRRCKLYCAYECYLLIDFEIVLYRFDQMVQIDFDINKHIKYLYTTCHVNRYLKKKTQNS